MKYLTRDERDYINELFKHHLKDHQKGSIIWLMMIQIIKKTER